MNNRSRASLVEQETEKIYKALLIASKEFSKQTKIRDEEILSEADLLAGIHYLSNVIGSRVLGLGEDRNQLLDQVINLIKIASDSKIKMGRKVMSQEMSDGVN